MRVLRNNHGFTLIELIVVMAILALTASIAIPHIPAFLGGNKSDVLILRSFIAKTFDNAFLRGENCYLVIHSNTVNPVKRDYDPDGILNRRNGVSVVILDKNEKLKETDYRPLRNHSFPDGFKIEKIILSNGETIRSGSAMLKFDSDGISNDAIIHLSTGESMFSVIIYRFRKEPMSVEEHVDFDKVKNGEIL